ncbi:hypothetical protein AGOR_G00101440 [Albula goreensis]|uniref:Uncharacterized protein n=1 Tax=Albula goreensis TaxID=1534307 RepID=A0A8T3DHV6_9TELE|nr:hypothetical protein AGOR_G00101440 [Albula goreensis]
MGDGTEKKALVISSTPISEPVQVVTSDPHKPATLAEQQEADPAVTTVTRPESPPSRTDSPLPLSPSKHEVRGSGLESGDADAFVVTDSFVYLAVSALPPFPPPSLQESAPPSPHLQPRSDPEEADFLSTDSFVYLAAPERHPLAGDGSSAGNSQDSDSDAGQSGVDFALGSTTADSDSDASESEPEPEPEAATSLWDPWEDLEPAVLHWLFYEDQSEKDLICEDQSEKELPSNNQSDWGISGPGGPACRLSPGPEVEELDDSSPNEEEVRHTPVEVEMAPLSASLAEEGGFLAPDEAAVPLALFWETHSRLEPWLQETEALLAHLPPPAIDLETLRQQQDQLRVLKESIAGHQCHVDKLLLIGPVLDPHSQEGAAMRCSYSAVEQRYHAIKEGVKGHSAALEEAISQSSQFYDKLEPLLETLERAVQRLRQRPPVAVELERIREQLAVHRAAGQELDKLLPSYNALCSRGDDPTAHVPHANPADPASQVVRARLRRLRSLWEEIRQRAQEREGKLLEVLDLAGKFWAESGGLLGMLREAQDITRKLEDPAVSPAHIRQQLDTTKAWRAEVGRLSDQLQALRSLGDDLITACGDTEKTLVKKTIDETYAAWDGLSRSLGERKQRLEEALSTAVQYQDALQGVYGYLDNAGVELRNMPAVGKELSTVRQQLQDLKRYKQVLFRQQRDMQKVRQQGELLLRSASAQSEREAIQKPLAHLTHLWRSLGDEVTHRQHELEVALLCLGQFQQALMEAESWLSQSHVMLDTLRPISCDPKAIEMELANHQVLRDDEFSHRSTMETINRAGAELLEASTAQEASLLRQQLDTVNQSWDSLVLKTQDRQALLEEALLEAKGFHSEVQDCLQWLRCTERQLSAAKPTGGLPETAREQLRQHMELQGQLCQQGEHFQALLERGRPLLMTPAQGGWGLPHTDPAGPAATAEHVDQHQQQDGQQEGKAGGGSCPGNRFPELPAGVCKLADPG